uniref:SRP54_N domain-containing protein n=1 Tax=Strongyloides venezuelensis TaxID=75913 RepID=A0A0K0G146_STRVS
MKAITDSLAVDLRTLLSTMKVIKLPEKVDEDKEVNEDDKGNETNKSKTVSKIIFQFQHATKRTYRTPS